MVWAETRGAFMRTMNTFGLISSVQDKENYVPTLVGCNLNVIVVQE